MRRFLVDHSLCPKDLTGSGILLNPSESHHVKNVIRLKVGEACRVFDRAGNEWMGFVAEYRKNGQCLIELTQPAGDDGSREARVELSMAVALPQDRKMDEIIPKAVELGIREIIPLTSDRTVVRMDAEKMKKALVRWNRIADQAMKQSGAHGGFRIQHVTPLENFWSHLEMFEKCFFLHPDPASPSLGNCAPDRKNEPGGEPGKILVMIGPEGGFSENEVKRARREGAVVAHLGERLLKVDTAFISVAGFFRIAYS